MKLVNQIIDQALTEPYVSMQKEPGTYFSEIVTFETKSQDKETVHSLGIELESDRAKLKRHIQERGYM